MLETPVTAAGSTPQSLPPLKGKIRPLTDEDVKLFLSDLEHRHGGENHWSTRQFHIRKRKGHGILVFAVERAVVGYMAYVLTDQTAALVRLLVHPERRRRRVGTQLLQKLAAIAGNRQVVACVSERLTGTLAFLRDYGIDSSVLVGPRNDDRDVVVKLDPAKAASRG